MSAPLDEARRLTVCTLSIIPLRDAPGADRRGFRIVTSRDEGRDRPPAHPPRIHRIGARRALWPVDALAGGTWIAAAENGLVLSILNANLHPAPPLPPPDQLISRGLIIPALIDSDTAREAIDRLRRDINLHDFAPFHLVAIDAKHIVNARWTRDSLDISERSDHFACYVSSGLGDHLMTPRIELFDRMFEVEDALASHQDAFHAHRWPDRPEISVLMSRDDASTVSITTVEATFNATGAHVEMRYTDAVGEHTEAPNAGETTLTIPSNDPAAC